MRLHRTGKRDKRTRLRTYNNSRRRSSKPPFRYFSALNKENIAVISVDAGSGDGGITIGVDEDNLDRAIKALYAKLIKRGM